MLIRTKQSWFWRAASALTLLGPLLLTGPASAQTAVNPGDDNVPVPVANPVYAAVAATVTAPVLGVDATPVTVFSGVLQHAVVQNADGTLDFLYQYTAALSSGDAVHRLTTRDFSGFTTEVYYRTTLPNSGVGDPVLVPPFAGFLTTGTITPISADRLSAGTVGFDLNPVPPGSTTVILGIHTNATHFRPGSTSVIDGATANVRTFAPSNVPEPAPIAMLGAGLLPLGLALLRRRKGNPVEETPNS